MSETEKALLSFSMLVFSSSSAISVFGCGSLQYMRKDLLYIDVDITYFPR